MAVRRAVGLLSARLKAGFARSWLSRSPDGQPDLVSLSIIGRDIRSRRIDMLMDFDTVVVLRDPMTSAKHAEVDRVFSELESESFDDISVSHRIADGPVKPMVSKRTNLFFHVILHTVDTYRTSPLVLVKTSWQSEAHALMGVELRDVQVLPPLALKEVLDGKLGIRHCKELVSSGSSAYLEWVASHEEDMLSMCLTPIKFSEACEVLEICYYAVLRGASNAVRYLLGHSWGIGIDHDDMLLFSKLFDSFRLKGLPLDFAMEKIKLRQGLWHPKNSDVRLRAEQALEFLELLDADLSVHESLRSPYSGNGILGNAE